MTGETRRKLSMAARALDFCRAYPSRDASYTGVVEALASTVAQADQTAMVERAGLIMERSALARRRESRRDTQRRVLRHLAVVAEEAAKRHPALGGKFMLPKRTGPHQAYLVASQAMLAAATEHHEILLAYGLGEGLLEELAASIAIFQTATEQIHLGVRDHVGARAKLEALTEECMGLVKRLDGLHRNRFKDAPAMWATWESARNVVSAGRAAHGEEETAQSEGGGAG